MSKRYYVSARFFLRFEILEIFLLENWLFMCVCERDFDLHVKFEKPTEAPPVFFILSLHACDKATGN